MDDNENYYHVGGFKNASTQNEACIIGGRANVNRNGA